MKFTASLDTKSILITIGIVITLILISMWHIRNRNKSHGKPINRTRAAAIAILLVVMGYCFLSYPRLYVVNRDKLIIKSLLSEVQIPVRQILDCRMVPVPEMQDAERIFGTLGIFGYNGYYHNKTIGDMKFYATRYSNFVLIHTLTGQSVILTPDKPKDMVDEITSDITINN